MRTCETCYGQGMIYKNGSPVIIVTPINILKLITCPECSGLGYKEDIENE